jgi:hypothetical protein
LQWDPDHDPSGRPLERRAIQLGLRGDTLRQYARDWILDIEDVSEFVAAQRSNLDAGGEGRLVTPREEPYPVADASVAARLGMP